MSAMTAMESVARLATGYARRREGGKLSRETLLQLMVGIPLEVIAGGLVMAVEVGWLRETPTGWEIR